MHDRIKRMQCRKALMILRQKVFCPQLMPTKNFISNCSAASCSRNSASCHVMKRESDVMRHPALFWKGYVFIENLMKALKYLRIALFYIL